MEPSPPRPVATPAPSPAGAAAASASGVAEASATAATAGAADVKNRGWPKLASEWSSLDPQLKREYVERAEVDRERYNRELKVYEQTEEYQEYIKAQKTTPSPSPPKKKKKKDKDEVSASVHSVVGGGAASAAGVSNLVSYKPLELASTGQAALDSLAAASSTAAVVNVLQSDPVATAAAAAAGPVGPASASTAGFKSAYAATAAAADAATALRTTDKYGRTATSSVTSSFSTMASSLTNHSLLKPPAAPTPVLPTGIGNCDVPIFTEEFLEFNKARETELRQLRKQTTDFEEQNAILQKHVNNMKSAITKLDHETAMQQENNNALEKHLDRLRSLIVQHFKHIKLPGLNETLTKDNADAFMNRLKTLVAEKSKDNQGLLTTVKDIASRIDYSSLELH